MFGLGTIAKLAKGGGIGPDEFAAICEAAGMEVEFTEVPRPGYRDAFGQAGQALKERAGSRMVRIAGRMKNGDQMQALIVLVPSASDAEATPKGCLTPLPAAL